MKLSELQFDPEDPACPICHQALFLKEGCEWSEFPEENVCPQCVGKVFSIYRGLLNLPEIMDFREGVMREAAHQRERWAAQHEAGKQPEDWFWLVGYLAGKALRAAMTGDREKAMHHTISTAAALGNWHAALCEGVSEMRPGISVEKQHAVDDGIESTSSPAAALAVCTAEERQTIDRCLEIMRTDQRISVSLIQRRLRLGYFAAVEVMDLLIREKLVAAEKIQGHWKILVDLGKPPQVTLADTSRLMPLLIHLIEREMRCGCIGESHRLSMWGVDALALENIILAVEKEFGITFPAQDRHRLSLSSTPQNLYGLILPLLPKTP